MSNCTVDDNTREPASYTEGIGSSIQGYDYKPACYRADQPNKGGCAYQCNHDTNCSGFNYMDYDSTNKFPDPNCLPNLSNPTAGCCVLKTGDLTNIPSCTKDLTTNCLESGQTKVKYALRNVPPSPGGGGSSLIIWIVVLALLLMGMVLGYYFWAKKHKTSKGGRTLDCDQINPYGY
jgi:hypothetical protein